MKLPRGVRQRGQSFLVDVQEGGTRKTMTVKTLKEAMEMRSILRAELCAGGVVRRTLREAYDQTCEESWDRAKAARSLKRNALCVLAFFGEQTALGDLTRDDVAAFETELRKIGNTDATINRKMAALNKMMTLSMEHGWITSRPIIHKKKEGRGRIRFMSPREETDLLGLFDQWGKRDHYDSAVVLLDTAFRTGELWDLERYQVDPEWVDPETGETVGMITIDENKTDLPRSIPMTERVREVMKRRLQTHTTHLFPYDNHWFEHVWDRARFIMGLAEDPQFVPYVCRHTCASRLLQKGMKLPELQMWLGHTNITMTMRYAHLCPTALLKGVRLLERGNDERVAKGNNNGSGVASRGVTPRVLHNTPTDAVKHVSRLRGGAKADPTMAGDIRETATGALGTEGEETRT